VRPHFRQPLSSPSPPTPHSGTQTPSWSTLRSESKLTHKAIPDVMCIVAFRRDGVPSGPVFFFFLN